MELKKKLIIAFALLGVAVLIFGLCYRIYAGIHEFNNNSISTTCTVLNYSFVPTPCQDYSGGDGIRKKRDLICFKGGVIVRYGANYTENKVVVNTVNSMVISYLNENYPIGYQFECWYDKNDIPNVQFEYYNDKVPLIIGIVTMVVVGVGLSIWGIIELVYARRRQYQSY